MLKALALATLLLLQAPAPGKLRWVPNPTPRGWVSDPAHHLKPETVAAIDSTVLALERETSAEMAVVVLDSLDGLGAQEAALLLHRRWGVGKRDKNNGVVFLWSPALRKTATSVGYRLEGILPDSRTGEIARTLVLPRFRAKDFDGGVLAGVQALAAAVREDSAANAGNGVQAYHPELTPEVADAPASAPPDEPPVAWILGGIGAAIAAAGAWLLGRRRRPPSCPNGHGKMTLLDEAHEDARLGRAEQDEERVGSIDWDVWSCARCDATVLRAHKKWFSGITQCPACERLTQRTTRRTLVAATTLSGGVDEVTTSCAHCGRTNVSRVETSRIVESTSSSSGSSFGSSDSGSSSSGSSFGGGSAGGGGSEQSY